MTEQRLMKWAQICIEYTMKCNAECRHCCVESSPRRREVMGVGQAKKYLDEAATIPSFCEVGIGGGEALIYFDDVLEIMNYAKSEHKYTTTISTNGYWARTPKIANEKLMALKAAGLRSLLVSVDDFHEEYVSLERVRTLLETARDLDVHCYAQSIVSKNSDIERIKHEVGDVSEQFPWGHFPCVPAGFATDRVGMQDLLLEQGIPRQGCTINRLIRVKVDGGVKPCCGAGVPDRLVLGNLGRDSLKEIVARINADPIINAIALWRGPRYLAQVLADCGYPEIAEGSYAGACHACGHILNNPELLSILESHLDAQNAELRESRESVERDHYFPKNYALAECVGER